MEGFLYIHKDIQTKKVTSLKKDEKFIFTSVPILLF